MSQETIYTFILFLLCLEPIQVSCPIIPQEGGFAKVAYIMTYVVRKALGFKLSSYKISSKLV